MGIARSSSMLGKITVFIVICFCVLSAQGKYGGGTGEPNDPYLIYTAEQMNAIGADSNDWDKHFRLMADIDLSDFTGTNFNIIGTQYNPFNGVFDGNGHAISNFTYDSNERDDIGLFGYVDYVGGVQVIAEIKNLDLLDPNINAGNGDFVGSIAGHLRSVIISNCRVNGGRVFGGDYVGGVVGIGSGTYSHIQHCHSNTTVSGRDSVGGLAGRYSQTKDSSALIENSSATGDVFATGSCLGGLVGINRGTISNSYATAGVLGDDYVGGLVGDNYDGKITNSYSAGSVVGDYCVGGLIGNNLGTISNSYSVGNVSGANDFGGLVGYNSGTVMASFWDIETSGQTASAGGSGKTTTEMQMASTFIGWTGCGNEGIWILDEGNDYPNLWWEQKPGNPLPVYQLSNFITGTGTESDPYLIYTPDELNKIGLFHCEWDKHFKLMADIDLVGIPEGEFNIIGRNYEYGFGYEYDKEPFTGVFEGCGRKIFNFSYTSTGRNSAGLFGYVDGPNAQIKNVLLINVDINTPKGRNVGSLIGYLEDGIVINCSNQGGLVTGNYNVGGLIGGNSGFVTDCYADCNVTSIGFACGGLVGSNEGGGRIWKSYADGTANSADNPVGALVGYNSGYIYECFASGSAWGAYSVGGLVGRNYHGTVVNCYAAGYAYGNRLVGGLLGLNDYAKAANSYSICSVTGSADNIGGLVGLNNYSEVTNCIWNIETSGQLISDGGIGLTTEQMLDVNSYLGEGWDFVCELDNGPSDMWAENPAGGYPILWWQLDPLPSLPTFSGGAGTYDKPYRIANVSDLSRIGHNPRLMDKHFSLINDVNLIDVNFFLIGNSIHPFTGKLNGKGNTVSNLDINRPEDAYIGFFRYVDGPDAEVSGLNLRKVNVKGSGNTGALAGFANGNLIDCSVEDCNISGKCRTGGLIGVLHGRAEHCIAIGQISSSGDYRESVGGLVGESQGEVSNCSSYVTVSGVGYVGGLVGYNLMNGKIYDSSSIVNSYGSEAVGGLVGRNAGWISRCYSEGEIYGDRRVGGLVGWCLGPSEIMILECYSNANVEANQYGAGGLVGDNRYASIYNCYSKGVVEGNAYTGGLIGGNGGDVRYCYSTGTVFGKGETIGGLVGDRWYNVVVVSSFWDTETSGQQTSDGGTGKTTVEMQTERAFTDAGWDFTGETANGTDDIWDICEGTNYPKLVWQIPIADFVCPDGVNFFDFSFFASLWTEDNCGALNDCEGRDLDLLGSVDIKDLGIFANNWLKGF
jgi:hypothetical protein